MKRIQGLTLKMSLLFFLATVGGVLMPASEAFANTPTQQCYPVS